MKYVTDVVVEFYSCVTYVKGIDGGGGGVGAEWHYQPSIFNTMSADKSLSWKFSILQLLKNRTFLIFELQDWYWFQKKRNFVILKVKEGFFSICELWEKLRRVEFHIFRQKCTFFKKKLYNSKTKMKFEKKLVVVLYSTKFRFGWYKCQLCRLNRSTVRFIIVDPFFLRFPLITRFLWRKVEKSSR